MSPEEQNKQTEDKGAWGKVRRERTRCKERGGVVGGQLWFDIVKLPDRPLPD